MNKKFQGKQRRIPLTLFVFLLIGLASGPEFFLSIELIAILNTMGVELFLLSFGGFQLLLFREAIKRMIERLDPYFFIPTRHQIRQLPGIVAHAVPLLVLVSVSGIFGALVEISES